jgi:hypothetical protein
MRRFGSELGHGCFLLAAAGESPCMQELAVEIDDSSAEMGRLTRDQNIDTGGKKWAQRLL